MDDHRQKAEALLNAVQSGDADARWRFKWEHPRFRDQTFDDIDPAALTIEDARLVIARENAFETWDDLERFTPARFEAAVDAVVNGDIDQLRALLAEDPNLVRARSTRRHHCTLLHYVGANGVEGWRQKTPPNAVEITRLLLDAGAEVDALADLYDNQCTTMSMLVSSVHPHKAGLQAKLAELLLDRGAALDGVGTKWQSPILTALAFGYGETAERIAHRGGAVNDLPTAAGLGRIDEARQFLPSASKEERHIALALAAQHGHAAIVQLLLDAGEDPSRYNPDGYHAHSTPLHQAVWSDHADVVKLLVERGARLDVEDKVHRATPLGWAEYGGRTRIAEYLRSCPSPRSRGEGGA